jgi:hypothetical protein
MVRIGEIARSLALLYSPAVRLDPQARQSRLRPSPAVHDDQTSTRSSGRRQALDAPKSVAIRQRCQQYGYSDLIIDGAS